MGNFYSFVQLHDLIQEFLQTLHNLPDYAENGEVNKVQLDAFPVYEMQDETEKSQKTLIAGKPEALVKGLSGIMRKDDVGVLVHNMNSFDISTIYPLSHNFDFIPCLRTRDMLLTAYKTITRLQKWEYLREYKVSEETGYMFSTEPTIYNLMDQIDTDYEFCHSGCSISYTMGAMDFIAKNGVESFHDYIVQNTFQPCQEKVDHVEESVVQEHWLHVNKKMYDAENEVEASRQEQDSSESISDDDMSALEPVSDDDEMPALEPVSDDDMPALEPVSDDDDDMTAPESISDDDDSVQPVTKKPRIIYDDEMPALILEGCSPSVLEELSPSVLEGCSPSVLDPSMYPLDPSFDFMMVYKDEAETAYRTVQRTEMWNYLYNYTMDETRGYMFSEDPKIIELTQQIQKDYGGMHSGGSMALTMRFMELIATQGFDVFKEECIRQKM